MTHVERKETVKGPDGESRTVVFCDECQREAEARRAATEAHIAQAHTVDTGGKARAPAAGGHGRNEGRGSVEVVTPQPPDARPERVKLKKRRKKVKRKR